MGIVRHENALFLRGIFLLQPAHDLPDPLVVFLKGIAQIRQDQFIAKVVLFADVHKTADPPKCGSGFLHSGVYMNEDIAAAFLKEACRLDSAQIVVRVDAADVLVLPLDPYDGNIAGRKLLGGNHGVEHDHPLDIVGKEFFNIAAGQYTSHLISL